MNSFNDKLIQKNNCKVCITCRAYYEGPFCQTCYNNTYNIYRTTEFLKKYNILPTNLFTRLLLIFSQIQTLYPWLHIIDYDYVLYKLLKLMNESIYVHITFAVKNTFVWHIIFKAIIAGVIIIL